jgi:predicted amidophosphoribosyltransferase
MPALNSVGFADNLDEVFDNIKDNFRLLSTSDFNKGDKGDSVDIEKIDLNEYPELFELLKSTITGGLDPQPIGGVSWDSLLGTDLYIINKTVIENGVERYVPISSLYYTFVDGRFVNDNVGNLSAEDFGDESDLSCILVYEDGEFKKLSNIFPNMYFEDGHGLCWMVNGQRTGLPVQGVPGKDGRNSDILIVRVKDNYVDKDGKGEVEETWNKLGNWTTIDDKESMDGYSCFALAPTEEGSTAFYAGKLTYENGFLYVICKPELSLQQTFDTQTFINVMQNISIKSNPDMIATPPGLFVPMKTLGDLTDGENQPIHLMTAASINNEMGNNELMTDMVVTPVKTTSLTIDADHDVKVDKYLYVRMSDEVRPLVEAKMSVEDGVFTNHKLKFKLSNIIFNLETINEPNVDNYGEKVYFLTENSFDGDGRLDANSLVPYDKFRDEIVKMLPAEFLENINKGIGIYAWSLDLSQDSFDPDNTLYTDETAPIKEIFPVVYTKTMTPGIGDDILWFNGLIVDKDDLYGEFGELFESVVTNPEEEVTPMVFMMRSIGRTSTSEVDSPTTDFDDNIKDDDGSGTTPVLPEIPTDLKCPVCGFIQYSSTTTCSNCGEDFNNPSLTVKVCPSCGKSNPESATTCWNCDSPLKIAEQLTKTCPSCGFDVPILSDTCPSCGYRFVDIPPVTELTEICPGCGTENKFLSGELEKVCSLCQYDFILQQGKVCPNCETHTTELERNNCENCNYNFYTHVVDEYDIPEPEPEPELPPINPTEKYKLLRGTDRESLIFDKFIPIYVNSYRMDRDTSYNLNYNVNITGDEINPKRTLSVYGDINCENINVYELTATGEIKNIYTKNEIVGEDGISLAKGKFHVDSNGNSTATTINANNIVSDSVESTSSTSNSLTVRQIDYDANGGISKETENIKVYPIDNDHTIDIDVNNVSSISIVGKSGDKANIDSDIPILLDKDSRIYISTNNELVGYKGNKITGKTGYNGRLDEKVQYYVNACDDNSKGKTTNKYRVKNNKSIYRCTRQTSLDGMTSKFGQTYIQVCNPDGFIVDYTFDGSIDNVSTNPITCNTTIDSTTLNVAKTQACCKFNVGNDIKNTSAVSFKLKFSRPFVFAVSMNTKCSNGYWTELKTANSKVVFKVVVVGTDPDDNRTKIWNPTQVECRFGDGDIEWSGYEQTLKTGNHRWGEFVRTRLFAIQPSDMTFTGNYMGYKNLEMYIVPTISLRFETQDDRNLIDYIGCSQFIPYSRTVSSKDKVYAIDINTNPDNIVFTNSYISDTQKQYISLDYEYTTEGAGFKATILDNTGLIHAHSNGAVMGLGYTPKGLGLYFYQKETCGGDPGAYKSIALTDVYSILESMASSYNL